MQTEQALIKGFLESDPAAAVRVLESYSAEQAVSFLDLLSPELREKVFGHLTTGVASNCLALMETADAARVVGSMSYERAAAALRRMDKGVRQGILDAMPSVARERVRRVMRYPEGTAGAIMSSAVLDLAGDVTAGEAKARLSSRNASRVATVWVVDREGKLVGAVSPDAWADASDETRMADLAVAPNATLSPHAALSTVIRQAAWAEADELPVVDVDGLFVGVLSHLRLRAWARSESGAEETDAFRTFLGLGELMWLGLHGLVDAVASTVIAEEQR